MCNFTGTVDLANPISLNPDDKYFNVGWLQQNAVMMTLDYINTARCGVALGGKRYRLALRTIDDGSSTSTVDTIAHLLFNSSASLPEGWNRPDILLGPYSSGLSSHWSPHAQKTGTLLVAGGASSTSVFAERELAFGTLPPSAQFLAKAR